MATASHLPVMVDRVVELLAVPADEGGILIDCTIGAAGHAARLIAASSETTHLVGFDRDAEALDLARRRLAAFADRVTLVHAPFDELTEHVAPLVERHGPVRGVLWDLGVSSMQLDTPGRGFSFRAFGPLDMRMDPRQGQTAADLVNTADVEELERIIRDYGEERAAARVARAIAEARPHTSTIALADLVERSLPAAVRRKDRAKGIHPATRTFQALCIAVNAELERFSASLPQALELAAPADGHLPHGGGRLATLSYHSLEDRIAKRFFSDAADGCICPPDLPVCGCGRVPLVRPLTRGAERPSDAEIELNPRARSARLRCVQVVAAPTAERGG